jgi:phosphoenolpyruvate synthase/pyruvate phosphate dikinase
VTGVAGYGCARVSFRYIRNVHVTEAGLDLRWLGCQECHDVSTVGGKAASLSRLAADYRVPAGFCLTTDGLARWDEGHALGVPPGDVRDALADAYRELGERCGETEPRVAVRSSAVDEDGRAASFAGQYETFLNVSGFDGLVQAVGRCRASLRSPRVVEYRRRNGLPVDRIHLAVLVQHLVPSDVSAVMFTANPVSASRDEIVINASWGLGESIVGGTVTPDMVVVRKDDFTVVSHHVAEKRRMTIAIPGGTREADVPRFLRTRAALEEAQVLETARLGLSLEARHGWPVDVECAWHDGRLYLLQCRPITTLS